MDYLQKNLQYLRENSPDLYHAVMAGTAAHAGETTFISTARNALVKTAGGECYLHSLYDSEREFRQICRDANTDAKVVILFGLGLGNALVYIADAFPDLEHLFIIEPNAAVFQAFLAQDDLRNTFRGFHKVSFIVNQSLPVTQATIKNLMNEERYHYMEILASTSYRTLYREYYDGVHFAIVEMFRHMAVNVATRGFYAYRWLINAWRNLKCLSIDLDHLYKTVPALPVIVVSAGPSLNKNLHLLTEAREKAVIIAVGSAMTILESHGITPHFRMAIDGNEGNMKIFGKVDTAKCPLIYAEGLYHEILPLYQGRKILFGLNSTPLFQYISRLRGKTATLISSGFSVANMACDLACKWGSPKIILIGQDLCYTEEKFHATGAWDDKDPFRKVDRGTMPKVKDVNNRDVYTDRTFLGMKWFFEKVAQQYPQIEFINASEGGLPIAGIPNKTFRAVLDEDLDQDLQVTWRIEEALQDYVADDATHLAKIVNEIEEQLQSMLEMNSKSLGQLRHLNDTITIPELLSANLQTLNEVAETTKKIRAFPYFEEVLYYYIEDRLRLAELDPGYHERDPMEKNKKFYESLVGQAVNMNDVLELAAALLAEYQGRSKLSVTYQS